jgi:hypothetical protein
MYASVDAEAGACPLFRKGTIFHDVNTILKSVVSEVVCIMKWLIFIKE